MTPEEQRFIDGWRVASPVLERLRNEELRKMDEASGAKMISSNHRRDGERQFGQHGLAIFQSWMMRLRVFELQESLR